MILPTLPTKTRFRKAVALLVAFSFAFSNIAFADIPKTSISDTKKQAEITIDPEKIIVPRDYGLIKSRYTAKDSKKLIIHIQDAHCNYEAQSNIIKILECLIKNDGLGLISVEGADGFIDTSWFKAFPDADIRKEVADYFMKKGEITGPEFLSITADYPIKLFGAETRSYYIENLNAFTSSYPLKEDTEKYFNQIKAVLNKLKVTIYNEELKEFDAKSQDYEAKKISFTDYVKYLENLAEQHRIALRQYDNLFKLVSVLIYEKKINFNVVDKERAALIDAVTKKLDKDQLAELVNKSLEFKSGKISSAEYYDYLKGLASKYGILLINDYPNLFNYIIYNSVYSRIENEKLFNDIKRFEEAIKDKLFANDEQRTLDKLSRHINILLGLVNIRLLNGDFDYYKEHKEEFAHELFADFINKMAARYAFAYEIEAPSEAVRESMPKLEDFYAIAVKRDKALVDNTIQAMRKEDAPVSVLVTGGFHSEGITKLLENQGISYVVVCPNITKEVETPYIKILTNQRTPLEEILSDTGVTTADAKNVKNGMLAPYLMTAARINHDKLIGLLQHRADEFLAGWTEEVLKRWLEGFSQKAKKVNIPLILDTALSIFNQELDNSVIAYIKDQHLLPEVAGPFKENAKNIKEKWARPALEKLLKERQAQKEGTKPQAGNFIGRIKTSDSDRAEAYSSPEKFTAYVEQKMQDLIAAIPKLEGLMKEYREMEKGKEKEALSKKIDTLIKYRYNFKIAEETIGASLENVGEEDVVKNISELEDFRKNNETEYRRYLTEARELRKGHGRGRIDVWGGAASRLFGEGQGRDTSLSYAGHDIYNVAISHNKFNREESKNKDAIFGLSVATRAMIQKHLNIEEELRREYGDSKTDKEIEKEVTKIVKNTPRIVIINDENGRSIINEFLKNDFYGANPELVAFVVQSAYNGWEIVNGKPVLNTKTTLTPVGHGDATMQIVQNGRAFTVNKRGEVNILKENAVKYLMKQTNDAIKIFIQSRVNDMTKLGASAADHPELSVNEIDMGIFALALKEMGNLKDLNKGSNAVLEQVGQDIKNPIKGGSPLDAGGKKFLIEGLAQSEKIAGLVGKEGVPFNRFFIFYKPLALTEILKTKGLPVYFRFRDGYIYPETVTGDITMLDGMNAGYVLEPTRQINDYKDIKGLENGVKAALLQDKNPKFQKYAKKYIEEKKDIALSDDEAKKVPGLVKHPGGGMPIDGAGAIRLKKDEEISQDDHGTRIMKLRTELRNRGYDKNYYKFPLSLKKSQETFAKIRENNLNGALERPIEKGKAYAIIKNDLYTPPEPGDILIPRLSIRSEDTKMIKLHDSLNSGTSFIVVKGLKAELRATGLTHITDIVFHYGVTRKAIYIDEEDFNYLFSLPNGVDIIMEGAIHERAHIDNELKYFENPVKNPFLSEEEIEKKAPSYNVRMAMALKDVMQTRMNMNIAKKQAFDGKDGYYKPVEKFAKFGTSGVRWLIQGAAAILAKAGLQEKTDYYISNKYKREIGGKTVLAEDFNMPNIGAVVKSIALYNLIKAQGAYPTVKEIQSKEYKKEYAAEFKKRLFGKGIIVVYDNRPGNEDIAKETARILAAYGIKAVLAVSDGRYVPTPIPAVSRLVRVGGYAGSITFTASHNGDEWNGIKFEAEDGGAASPEVTNVIGAILAEELALKNPAKPVEYDIAEDDVEALIKQGKAATIDTLDFYAKEITGYLDIAAIKRAVREGRVEFIYSAFFGSSGPAMIKLFEKLGLLTDNIIETQKSADQGYVPSYEPTLEKLETLVSLVEKRGREINEKGLKTVVIGGSADNDADRFQVNQFNRATGRVEEYPPEKLAAILGHYLYKYEGFKGPLGRSFVTGTLQDQVARLFGYDEPVETATGFKFSPKVFIEYKGVLFTEESYGLSFKDWTLDKDGILPSLLALELVAVTGKSLDEYYQDILSELSEAGFPADIYFKRYDLPFEREDLKEKAIKSFSNFFNRINVTRVKGADIFEAVKGSETVFAGRKIARIYNPAKFDNGMKVVFENGSWIAFRSSGTEPLVRIYVEGRSEQEMEELRRAVFGLIGVSTTADKGAQVIGITTPEDYSIGAKLQTEVPDIINSMAAETGRWATDQFKDAGKTMLGWMNLGEWRQRQPIAEMMKDMDAFAKKIHGERKRGDTTDVVFVGQGGSIECIKTFYATFGKMEKSPNVHIVDTIDQEVIASLKSTLPLNKTRFVIISKSMTTAEVHSIYKLFFDEALKVTGSTKKEVAKKFTLITDYGKAEVNTNGAITVSEKVREPFRSEVLNRGFTNVFYIEPNSGGRYSWDTAVGILPAMIMGHEIKNILKGAETVEISAKNPNLAENPSAQYGVFKYMMNLAGRNRPTLILPVEIGAYGPWNGQLDTESLGKYLERSSLTIDHEKLASNPEEYTQKRFFVRIKMGADDTRYDKAAAGLEKYGFPVFTITLPNSAPGSINEADFGALLKMSEFATAIAGYLIGVNPVNQPGVEDYKKAQEAGLTNMVPEKSWKPGEFVRIDYEGSLGTGKINEVRINEVLAELGSTSAAAKYASLLYLAAKENARDYAVMMIFKRLTTHPSLITAMGKWRASVRKDLRIDTLGEEAPCILHAKQQGFQQGENSGFFTIVRFAEYGKEKIEIPLSREALEKYGGKRTFEDLIKAQSYGTLSALSAAGRLGVMIEIKNTEKESISEFEDFIEDTLKYLDKLTGAPTGTSMDVIQEEEPAVTLPDASQARTYEGLTKMEKVFADAGLEKLVVGELSKVDTTEELSAEIKNRIITEAVGLRTTLYNIAAPETTKKIILLGYDTGLDQTSNAAARAGEAAVNKYLNNTLIEIRAAGKELPQRMKQEIIRLKTLYSDKEIVVITATGEGTLGQLNNAERQDLGKILDIMNVVSETEIRPIPILGLYDLVLRIAYGQDERDILLCLNRIAYKGDNEPFTKDDIDQLLNSGLLRIIPKAAPVNMTEVIEVHKAAQAVARAL